MNHLLITTTCFQNTLGSFLDRHLAIIKSLRKQKLDLAPNTRPSLPIPSTWSGNDIILSRGRGAAGLQNKLSIQLRSHTVRLLVCEDFRRFCGGLLQILRIPHTGMGYFWWYPHDLDMFTKHASGSIGTNHCVKEGVFESRENCYCWWFHLSSLLIKGLCYPFMITLVTE